MHFVEELTSSMKRKLFFNIFRLREYYGKDFPDYDLSDIIGSPYAVVDYLVNPDIGTEQDLKDIKKKLNDMGLQLMTDFVPNHSAVDSKETTKKKFF